MIILSFRGHAPEIHHGAFVAPTASVIGQVSLAEGSSVFYGAVLRGDSAAIRIGRASNLQDNVVVHADPGFPATVGSGVSVGHGAVLHGCTVGDDSLVGMNATVLNGAVVGRNCLVAAGALVREGMIVPDGSLVAGVPAAVRRELSEEEREAVRENARHYVELARGHSEEFAAAGES